MKKVLCSIALSGMLCLTGCGSQQAAVYCYYRYNGMDGKCSGTKSVDEFYYDIQHSQYDIVSIDCENFTTTSNSLHYHYIVVYN